MLIFIICSWLNALRSHTGLESTMCAVRGSTDIALRPIYFEMEGLTDFMGTAMRIDKQDLTTRMEGYSIQGIRGKLFCFMGIQVQRLIS